MFQTTNQASIYTVKSPTTPTLHALHPLMKLLWRDTKCASRWLKKPPEPGTPNFPINDVPQKKNAGSLCSTVCPHFFYQKYLSFCINLPAG